MKKYKKRILLVLTAVLVLITSVLPAAASNRKSTGKPPAICSNGTCSLSFSGRKATVSCHVINKGADRMTVHMELLKYKNGKWVKVQSCCSTMRKSRISLSRKKLVTPGRYRAKVTVVAAKGTYKKTTSYYSAVAVKK